MPTLTSLTVNLKGDSSSLVKASQRGLRSIKNLSGGVARTVVKFGALAGAISGIAGAGGLLAIANAARGSVDQIGKLSTQLGISGTEVQKLGLVAELSGVKSEGLTKGMQRITRILGDAGEGSKEARKLFASLGLQWDQLTKKSPVERLRLVMKALADTTDATRRASLGNKLFEEQWQRFGPLIQGFESNMQRASAVFDRMKFGIGDLAGGVESMNDHFSVGLHMLKSFSELVVAKLAPVVGSVVQKLGAMAEAWILANGGASKLADTLILDVLDGLTRATAYLGTMKDAIAGVKPVVGSVVQKLGAMAEAWILANGGASKLADTLNLDVLDGLTRATAYLGTMKDAIAGVKFAWDLLVDSLKAIGLLGAGAFAAGEALLQGNAAGAGEALRASISDATAVFHGYSGDRDDPSRKELEKQTDLLREVVRNGATGALVF